MSDWLRAEDYTTLEEVFSSPGFTRDLPPETLAAEPALFGTAAAAAAATAAAATLHPALGRSMRDRAIASLCAAGAAVSVVGTLVIGSGPVGVPLATAPLNPPGSGQSGSQSPVNHLPHEFELPGGTGQSGQAAVAAGGNAATGVVAPASPTGPAPAAGGTPSVSLVSDTFPAPRPGPGSRTGSDDDHHDDHHRCGPRHRHTSNDATHHGERRVQLRIR